MIVGFDPSHSDDEMNDPDFVSIKISSWVIYTPAPPVFEGKLHEIIAFPSVGSTEVEGAEG